MDEGHLNYTRSCAQNHPSLEQLSKTVKQIAHADKQERSPPLRLSLRHKSVEALPEKDSRLRWADKTSPPVAPLSVHLRLIYKLLLRSRARFQRCIRDDRQSHHAPRDPDFGQYLRGCASGKKEQRFMRRFVERKSSVSKPWCKIGRSQWGTTGFCTTIK
jgi:hypothetical protein